MNFVNVINLCLGALLVLCYLYQFIFLVISYVRPKNTATEPKSNRIAVLVCARNEEAVIGRLVDRLVAQDYPKELYEIFVLADNCTDSTAKAASERGATVFERENKDEIGKGYALDYLIRAIKAGRGEEAFDAFIVFDADNLPEESFLTEINKTFSQGYDCVTSYRAPMNYSDGWLAAGQSMCFLRDAVMLNRARARMGSFSFISGTGYMFSAQLCREFGGGWPFHTLTEDCEFSAYNAVRGSKMGFADAAVFRDEQPKSWRQSFRQRLRWCRGGIEVFKLYSKKLIRGIFSRRFLACFDMTMCMAPAYIISTAAIAVNLVTVPVALCIGYKPLDILLLPVIMLIGAMILLGVFGVCLTVSERKKLDTGTGKLILYAITFPLYMATFVPIAVIALFKKNVKWKPIERRNV